MKYPPQTSLAFALRRFFASGLLLATSGACAWAATHYVDLNSTNATPPYINWATAATNIQDAVDAAMAGDEILVTNGIYATGGRNFNRVDVDKPLTLRSLNGPQFTLIEGQQSPDDDPARCVYLTNGASLCGFTLTNGFAYSGGGLYCEPAAFASNCLVSGSVASSDYDSYYLYGTVDGVGGGAYGGTLKDCTLTDNLSSYGGATYSCTLTNCTLAGNSAEATYPGYQSAGGGAAYSTLNNCRLTANGSFGQFGAGVALGGAAYNCRLNNCTLTGNSASAYQSGDGVGGGAYGCTLNNCTLTYNDADFCGGAFSCTLNNCMLNGNSTYGSHASGGGAAYGTLNNCTLSGNNAQAYGGGAYGSKLNNCTLSGNSAYYVGGASACTVNNCVVYFNSAVGDPNCDYYSSVIYSCTTPQPTNGFGNITNAPQFVDTNGWANLHLQSNSPCINAGNNAYAPAGPDLDGNPRIVGGTVDIGAYEYQSPVSQISYAWLQQYGLPISASTDISDPDGDAVDNYHEWLAGTDPTNPLSSPAHLTITPSGLPPSAILLTWSTNAVGFTLLSTTNLLSPASWVTNSPAPVIINGQNTVTNPITGPQQFYRLIH